MDLMFEAYLSQDNHFTVPDDFPRTSEPVWILGKKYNAVKELSELRKDVQSRLWFTYRRGFVPIGDSGLTSDKGWGCMLRCGQMVLGQALIRRHLGRDWQWTAETADPTYLRIVRMFEDRRTARYSIHQIALMGASEGKQVGHWFGPNTVAQVLRKLAQYDDWSSLVIHIALDNTVVINDIKRQCKTIPGSSLSVNSPVPDPSDLSVGQKSLENTGLPSTTAWRPLVLIVPLRLGLSEINPVYAHGLQACFTFEQSLGVIGGKPNHALYFIGCVGDEVVYLDPHTTQTAASVDDKRGESQRTADSSFHCPYASRMPLLHMDPSVAACFYCGTEAEFDNLCRLTQKYVVTADKQPLFEVTAERPRHWSPPEDPAGSCSSSGAGPSFVFPDIEHQDDDSDEDFELLG